MRGSADYQASNKLSEVELCGDGQGARDQHVTGGRPRGQLRGNLFWRNPLSADLEAGPSGREQRKRVPPAPIFC